MEIWELIARESIRDLVARYNANGDSGRLDQMMDTFADDAVVEGRDREYVGKDEIRKFFSVAVERTKSGQGGVKWIRHNTATLQIDVLSETEAKGRCYYTVLTDRGLDHWGRYIDDYRKIGDRWLIWRRAITSDARVEGSWAEAGSQS